MNRKAVVINTNDNVATVVENAESGDDINFFHAREMKNIVLKDNVPCGHKIAIKPIVKGQDILKYGESIGKALQDIRIGEHVHVHNIASNRGRGDLN
ncbi:SAF domain protein [Syntrophobotulus glycolicus DSM 8271]|uniref:SAF domain protein n=1 Tax=Syntrophobotulus glycolicus (strain DSM 8271 / FlGlyR) TaxID=645991 RepID=F0T054_SYNGF|nr:UxaA family hydrolase [Syntrophobotulus glycolicus]ADY56141.1 SAF domain protein [Syntrophobotulus glycolicus DSM 8271]